MKNSLLKVQDAVLLAMEEKPETRDDNIELIKEVYKMYGLPCVLPKDGPSPGTITRCRRKIQEHNIYPVTAETQLDRQRNEWEMKHINQWYEQ